MFRRAAGAPEKGEKQGIFLNLYNPKSGRREGFLGIEK